jgi:energy-coupling factor transporter ATP-binding protein EcfA2
MSLLQQILVWSQSLPEWQSDAVSRLLKKQTLSDADKEELYALLKAVHGIPDPQGRTAKPLTASLVPASLGSATSVTLLAIKNLRHVNALAEDHRLGFGNSGLTVIYGDNGSGKSGYSRVLKRACRARDQSEKIYPNANLKQNGLVVAEADFEVSVSGALREVHWSDGATPPEVLSSIAIFDTRCARAYLDQEDDFSYVPYGLDIFDGLANLCNDLKTRTAAERAQNAVDLTVLSPLLGTTRVGTLVSNLSHDTQVSDVEALCTLRAEELTQHAAIASSLKESDPKEKAASLRLKERRFSALAKLVLERATAVSSVAIAEIRARAGKVVEAAATAKFAAEQFSSGGNLLPGTGGDAWRRMFEAARIFATESHPGSEFPHLPAGSPCPLCQEPLEAGATALKRFQTFIEQAAEKQLVAARARLNDVFEPFAKSSLALKVDEATFAELESINPLIGAELQSFEKGAIDCQQSVVVAVALDDWSGVTTVEVPNPAQRLNQMATDLKVEIEALIRASDESLRASLQGQFDEMDARVRLKTFRETILAAITKLRHNANLDICERALSTRGISLKATELTQQAVSSELADALNREFKALSVGGLRVTLESRTHKGKPLHKLKLALPKSHSPRDILSEGEQRSVAIGSFLAEVNLGGGQSAIVFDDPVSSLDHSRREAVARRLVTEGKKRQVIIFTHCLYFGCLLEEEALLQSVPLLTQSLTKKAGGLGMTEEDLPFEGKTTAKRVSALLLQQVNIAKLHEEGNEIERRRETIEAYSLLRSAWERAVEEVLLDEVVLRFRKGISTQRLAKVLVEDSDYQTILAGMTRCSNYAHDKAILGGVAIPDPDELREDIQALEDWRRHVVKRKEVTSQLRKGGAGAPMSNVQKVQAAVK